MGRGGYRVDGIQGCARAELSFLFHMYPPFHLSPYVPGCPSLDVAVTRRCARDEQSRHQPISCTMGLIPHANRGTRRTPLEGGSFVNWSEDACGHVLQVTNPPQPYGCSAMADCTPRGWKRALAVRKRPPRPRIAKWGGPSRLSCLIRQPIQIRQPPAALRVRGVFSGLG